MADEESEDEPAVELGPEASIEGAPIARVASRLSWPARKSDIEEQEGDSTIRTPEGPKELQTMLDSIETTYFDRRQTFIDELSEVTATGAVPTDS